MTTRLRITCLALTRPLLLAGLLLALPRLATAQSVPASGSTSSTDTGSMPQMDHGDVPGMAMPAAASSVAKPATKVPAGQAGEKPVPVPSTRASHDTEGMGHGSMPGMDHGAKPNQSMGPMQGGNPPPNARSPDYSDGLGHGSMQGMEMADELPLGMLLIDRLEAFHGRDGDGQSWEAEGWYGDDRNKLWLRSEGEAGDGRIGEGQVEALWSHAAAAFWDTQLGVRQDVGNGPHRTWAAFGIQGLAPYWFELQATGYLGPSGRTAARFRAEYELLFTQRLILQPEFELNLYGRNDPATRSGQGLSDATLGLRLRYEIRRGFAPYIGVVWTHRHGTSADYARQDGEPATDRQLVAGVRFWL